MNNISQDPWYFPPSNGGEESGLSDGMMDIFPGIDNLGRESAQNCIGANNEPDKPVLVKYQLKYLDSDLFPGKENYLKRLESASNYYSTQDEWTGDEYGRLQRAIEVLKKTKIPVLVISDFHTTGLFGSESEKGAPYFKFLKSSGISTRTPMSPGTYGYGKNALVKFSALRAISVYSKHIEHDLNGDIQSNDLYVGRSVLCTHKDPETNQETQKVGYYALKDESNYWSAFRGGKINEIKVPIAREQFGTDIYVWGYEDQDALNGWDIKLAMGLFYAFFQAIREEKIKFEIYHEDDLVYEINSDNLVEFSGKLETDCIKNLGTDDWEASSCDLVSGYLKCTESSNSSSQTTEIINIKNIGDIILKIYSNKEDLGLRNNFCIMRKPLMTIESHEYNPSGKPYQAVCMVINDRGNNLLADMENGSHTELHMKYVRNKQNKRMSQMALRELKREIKKRIDLLTPKIGDNSDIPGLNELLWGDSPQDDEGNSLGEGGTTNLSEDEIETLDMILKPEVLEDTPTFTKRKKKSIVIETKPSSPGTGGGNRGDHGGEGTASGGKGTGAGNGQGPAKLDTEGKNKSYVPSESIKIIRTRSSENKDISKLRIKAIKKIKGDLRLGFALDEKGKEFVPISNYQLVNSEKIIKDKSTLTFENLVLSKDEIFEFEIKFSSTNNFAVGAY